MLKGEELRRAYFGEFYRYRLAVQDQLGRVEAMKRVLRAEQEEIEKDIDDHLFAPSMNLKEWEEQLKALHDRQVPVQWRLKTEAEFLLAAVYGIYMMAKALRRFSGGGLRTCVQRAISAFEKAAPDAPLLRHLHVHIDEYVRGEGKHRARLPDPNQEMAMAMVEDGLAYWIGGKLFILSELAAAAETMAAAIADCSVVDEEARRR